MNTIRQWVRYGACVLSLIAGPAIAGHINTPAGRIAFTRFDPPLKPAVGDIYAMNPDGANLSRLTTAPTGQPADSIDPSFSPGGAKIVFSSSRHDLVHKLSDIYVMDSWDVNNDGNGDNCRRLTTDNLNGYESGDPAWSPLGNRIVFSSNRSGQDKYELYLMNPDGTGQVKLISSPSEDTMPNWSRDGTYIVFTRGGELYKVEVASKTVTRITNDSNYDQSPDLNSTNNLLLSSYRNGIFQVYVLDQPLPGANEIRFTQSEVSDINPAWSPDDGHIIFSRTTGPKTTTLRARHNLFIIDANGANPTNISNAFVSDVGADWGAASAAGSPGGLGNCAYFQ